MKKILKRLAVIVLVFLTVVTAAAVITATMFEQQVGRRIIAALNRQLVTELTVESFDLTVLSTFPNVAANLRGIELKDNRDAVLLEADRLAFNFGLLSFLSSSYKVKSVVLSGGAVNISFDRKGKPNYTIFRESEKGETPADPDEDDGIAVSLESAKLQDIGLIYSDAATRRTMSARIEEARFSGDFSDRQFEPESNARIESAFLEIKKMRYLVGKMLTYDAHIAVDLENGIYALDGVKVEVESNEFSIDGKVEELEDGTYFDLSLASDNGNLEGIIQLLPEEYLASLGDFSSSGDFEFNATVKGESNKRENPELRAALKLEDGRIRSPRLTEDFKDVSFTAVFSNGKNRNYRSSVFEIKNLKGYFNRELIELKLSLNDFDDPNVDFLLDGVVPMSAVYKFIAESVGDPRLNEGFGEIEIKQLQLNGRFKDMVSTSRIGRVAAAGQLIFDDAGVRIGNERLIIDRGTLQLQGNQLNVKDLKIEGPDSDLNFSGSAFNIIPVIFADSVNSNRAELEFSAELTSGNLDLDELMKLSPYAVSEKTASPKLVDSLKTRQIQTREHITSFLKGTFNARVDAFNYEAVNGRNFSGQLKFDNNRLDILGSANAMEGVILVDGRLFLEDQPRLEARLTTEDIDVSAFFQQSKNFGQDVLKENNVSGRLNARMIINAFWDAQGNFRNDKLRVFAGIGINDGALKDFKLLESFSAFVKVQDLKNINFENVQNFLEVRNETLYIPVMFVRSNALNLTVSGEHNFDNEFRYNLMVNAGQVLIDRFKRYDPALQPKPARRHGFFNLHYTIFGSMDDYDLESAKRLVRSEFERSQQRKREIERALANAFGRIDLIDEPEEWRDIDAPPPPQAEEEPEFLDFEIQGKTNGKNNP